MATEVHVRTWCDRCTEQGRRTTGQAVTLKLPEHSNRELDLCDECKVSVDELLVLLNDYSRTLQPPAAPAPAPAAAAPEPVNTPEPAPAPAPAPTSPAPTSPATSPPGRLDRYGTGPRTCPVCGSAHKHLNGLEQHVRGAHNTSLAILIGTDCPLCGAHSPRLGLHTRNVHGTGDLLKALEQAEAEGDVHGVAATVRARFTAARQETAA